MLTKYSKLINLTIILILFIMSLTLRIYGLDWDQGNHLHPDERFLTMVANDIKLPSGINQYFDTLRSPLNPANSNYGFFVYGTLPLFLTKITAVLLQVDNYERIHLVGRVLSAIIDSSSIIALYFITKKIIKSRPKLVFLPSTIYCFAVLPLQLSHFYAVDTYLSFFILLTFTWLGYRRYFLAAISFGLALACKISALYFVPIIGLFVLFKFIYEKKFLSTIFMVIYSSVTALVVFRIFQPYTFTGLFGINPLFINSLKELQSYSDPEAWFPPAVQWSSKIPLQFTLQNIIYWGIGLPVSLGLIILIILFFLRQKFNLKALSLPSTQIVITGSTWILLLYFYQGSQFAHNMRYFLPLYPFVFILFAFLADRVKFPGTVIKSILLLHVIWGLFFLSIYSRPHSRVQASRWIFQNIPAGSPLTNEHWDDVLPLTLSPQNYLQQYPLTTLNLYDPDTVDKWQKINADLTRVDYLVMSSNRLWASIPQAPRKYPIATKFYQDLFDGKLAFTKVAEFNSYPGINLSFLTGCYYFGPGNFPYRSKTNTWFSFDPNCYYPGIYIRDDIAEESFSVYDHPKVLIYARKR